MPRRTPPYHANDRMYGPSGYMRGMETRTEYAVRRLSVPQRSPRAHRKVPADQHPW